LASFSSSTPTSVRCSSGTFNLDSQNLSSIRSAQNCHVLYSIYCKFKLGHVEVLSEKKIQPIFTKCLFSEFYLN
jgi:hypothetical protein